MGVPTVPTVTSILTEAFRRCGIPSPTTAQLLRAEDEWLEEVKQELYTEKRWHNLEDTQTIASVASQQAYALPSPLYRILLVRFKDQNGNYWPMEGPQINIKLLGTSSTATASQSTLWEEFENTLYVWPIPDASTYTYEIDGIVDISLVDETDARMTRVLREWRPALLYGVMSRIAQDQQDFDWLDRLGDVDGNGLYGGAAKRLMRNDARKRRGLMGSGMKSMGGMPRWRM